MISEEIYSALAKKHKLKISVIKSICRSPYELVRSQLETDQKTLLIANFGKFGIKPFMKERLKERKDAKTFREAQRNSSRLLEFNNQEQKDKSSESKEITNL